MTNKPIYLHLIYLVFPQTCSVMWNCLTLSSQVYKSHTIEFPNMWEIPGRYRFGITNAAAPGTKNVPGALQGCSYNPLLRAGYNGPQSNMPCRLNQTLGRTQHMVNAKAPCTHSPCIELHSGAQGKNQLIGLRLIFFLFLFLDSRGKTTLTMLILAV